MHREFVIIHQGRVIERRSCATSPWWEKCRAKGRTGARMLFRFSPLQPLNSNLTTATLAVVVDASAGPARPKSEAEPSH
jgi:hypothetical protein